MAETGTPPDPEGEGESPREVAAPADKPEKEKARTIPPPVQAFLDTHALPDRYTLVLGRRNSRSGREETLQTYFNYFPDVEEIGRDFGVGDFFFIFSFYNSQKRKRDKLEPIDFVLAGDHYEEIYAAEKDRKEKIRLTNLARSGILTGGERSQSPLQSLKEAADILEKFGGGSRAPAIDLTPLSEAIKAQGENFRAALEHMNRPKEPLPAWATALLGTSITALVNKVLDKLTAEKKGEEDPMGKAMDKLIGLGEKFGMFKDLVSPKEPDKWDRIISLAEVIFTPLVERLASLPPAARKEDPTVKMITGSKDFKDLMSDPEGLKKFMAKFYDKFGARRTVIAMESCGLAPTPELKKEAEAEQAEEDNAEDAAPGAAAGAPGTE